MRVQFLLSGCIAKSLEPNMRSLVKCSLSAFASTSWHAARCTWPDLSLTCLMMKKWSLLDDEEWSWRYLSLWGFATTAPNFCVVLTWN